MIVSTIITTYNSPGKLDLVLCGMTRQHRPPDEVLIADDGSSEETSDLIASWTRKLGKDLKHIWQCDRGFRKTRITNEAVRQARGDHLIFLDGDAVPHSLWVADHLRAADGNRILCGRRVKLGKEVSNRIRREAVLRGDLELLTGPVSKSALAGDTKRFLLGIRLPVPMARGFHPRPRKLMGVNFSLPRRAYERVNGYDEDWANYECEDRDLELRLIRSGYPLYPLLNRAIVYHLYHPMRPVSEQTEARVRLEEASTRTRCENGLFLSGEFDPYG